MGSLEPRRREGNARQGRAGQGKQGKQGQARKGRQGNKLCGTVLCAGTYGVHSSIAKVGVSRLHLFLLAAGSHQPPARPPITPHCPRCMVKLPPCHLLRDSAKRMSILQYAHNPSPVSLQRRRIYTLRRRGGRCVRIRSGHDGDYINPISIRIPLFASLEPRSGTAAPSKAQALDHGQACEYNEEAGWDIKAQAIQKSQWMYNVQGETIEVRRNETIMSTMSQEECDMWGIQEGFQMEAVRGDDVLK